MNFHRLNKKTRLGYVRSIWKPIAFVVALLLLILSLFGISPRDIGRFTQAHIARVGHVASPLFDAVYDVVRAKRALSDENRMLKQRITELELYAINNIALRSENDALWELYNSTRRTHDTMVGEVLSVVGEFPYGTFTLAPPHVGAYAPGALVFGPGNIALGTIERTDAQGASVKLFSAPGSVVGVRVLGVDKDIPMELKGEGLGNFSGRISRDAGVAVGDVVVLVSDPSVVIAQVSKVTASKADAVARVRAHVPITLSGLRFVSVEKGN